MTKNNKRPTVQDLSDQLKDLWKIVQSHETHGVDIEHMLDREGVALERLNIAERRLRALTDHTKATELYLHVTSTLTWKIRCFLCLGIPHNRLVSTLQKWYRSEHTETSWNPPLSNTSFLIEVDPEDKLGLLSKCTWY